MNADPPVAQADQVLGRVSPSGPVRGGDGRRRLGPRPHRVHHDHRYVEAFELRAAGVQELRDDDHDALGPALDELIDPIRRADRAPVRRLDDQVDAEPAGLRLRAPEQGGGPLRFEVVDDEVNQTAAGPAGPGARSRARGAIARPAPAFRRRRPPGRSGRVETVGTETSASAATWAIVTPLPAIHLSNLGSCQAVMDEF